MDGAGLLLWEEKEDRRFSQPELVLDSLLSVVLLLVAVRGRNMDRRDFELSLEDGVSLVESSFPNMKSLGADHWRGGCDDWIGRLAEPAASIGVAGCEMLRRGNEAAAEATGQLAVEEPGHFRLPGRSICGSMWSVPNARPAAAAPMVPRAQSCHQCQPYVCLIWSRRYYRSYVLFLVHYKWHADTAGAVPISCSLTSFIS